VGPRDMAAPQETSSHMSSPTSPDPRVLPERGPDASGPPMIGIGRGGRTKRRAKRQTNSGPKGFASKGGPNGNPEGLPVRGMPKRGGVDEDEMASALGRASALLEPFEGYFERSEALGPWLDVYDETADPVFDSWSVSTSGQTAGRVAARGECFWATKEGYGFYACVRDEFSPKAEKGERVEFMLHNDTDRDFWWGPLPVRAAAFTSLFLHPCSRDLVQLTEFAVLTASGRFWPAKS
jgi:hypothetical protein